MPRGARSSVRPMCARKRARSVARMRPPTSSPRRRRSGGGGPRPPHGLRGRCRLRRQHRPRATRSSSAPTRRAGASLAGRLLARRAAPTARASRVAATLTPAEPVAGFSPGADELLISRNAKGAFTGTQLAGVRPRRRSPPRSRSRSRASSSRARHRDPHHGREDHRQGHRSHAHLLRERMRWTATRTPGIIYGGVTSQGEPIVLRLDAAPRARQRRRSLAWHGQCAPRAGSSACPSTS